MVFQEQCLARKKDESANTHIKPAQVHMKIPKSFSVINSIIIKHIIGSNTEECLRGQRVGGFGVKIYGSIPTA
jgi:hypothetical protein